MQNLAALRLNCSCVLLRFRQIKRVGQCFMSDWAIFWQSYWLYSLLYWVIDCCSLISRHPVKAEKLNPKLTRPKREYEIFRKMGNISEDIKGLFQSAVINGRPAPAARCFHTNLFLSFRVLTLRHVHTRIIANSRKINQRLLIRSE